MDDELPRRSGRRTADGWRSWTVPGVDAKLKVRSQFRDDRYYVTEVHLTSDDEIVGDDLRKVAYAIRGSRPMNRTGSSGWERRPPSQALWDGQKVTQTTPSTYGSPSATAIGGDDRRTKLRYRPRGRRARVHGKEYGRYGQSKGAVAKAGREQPDEEASNGEGSTPYRYGTAGPSKITWQDELDLPYRKTVYGATKAEVEAKRRELLDRADKGLPVAREHHRGGVPDRVGRGDAALRGGLEPDHPEDR